MWIEKVALKNWGIYRSTTFDFPKPDSPSRSNVVLVGGENGRGKTSLLRAIAFCLYGQDAVEDYNRGGKPAAEPAFATYKNNLDSIFSENASSPVMSVQIDMKIDDRTFSIKREWKFADRSFTTEKKETVEIFQDGKSLTDSVADIEIPYHVKKIVSDNLIPYSLARFFLFDSAKVMELADRSKSQQIKEGVDSILGIRVLRTLIEDLNKYIGDRTRGADGDGSTKRIDEINKKIEEAEKKSAHKSDSIKKIDAELTELSQRENTLIEKLTEIGAKNLDIGKLIKSRAVAEEKRKSARDRLKEAICEGFTMLAAGRAHIDSTLSQMAAEQKARAWESVKKTGDENLSKFMGNIEGKIKTDLPVNDQQAKSLMSIVKDAWHEVFHPAPEGTSVDKIHGYLSDEEMDKSIKGIVSLRQKGGNEILAICQDYSDAENEIAKIDAQGSYDENAAKDSEKIKNELKSIQGKKTSLASDKERLKIEKSTLDGTISGQKQERGRLVAAEKSNLPRIKQAKAAQEAIDLVQGIIKKSRSRHLIAISEKMTSAFLSMAHKNDVIKVVVLDDCAVEMIREDEESSLKRDFSHGESQIFTLALISAIVKVSGKMFPFVIDTPLGVLDEKHRHDFLKHYSSDMENQVILLSTDSEVRPRGRDYNTIQSKVACKCTIYQEGQGVVVRNGYFEEQKND